MCSGAAEASTTSSGVWNVEVAEWIVEARCWVLRDRAWLTGTVVSGGWFCFFWVTARLIVVGCGGWGRLSLNCWWVCLMGVLFPWMVGLSGVWWGLGRCSCPYFENCIVDASISL